MNILFDAYVANNVAEFLSFLTKIQDYFHKPNTPGDFLFRGEPRNDFSLIPSIYRSYEEDRKLGNCGVRGLIYKPDEEKNILEDFIKEAAYQFPHLKSDDYLRWMTIAQHHGAPTRLLDWTSNPLVALFFCCASLEQSDGVVWVLNTDNYKKWMLNDDVFINKPNNKQEDLESYVIDDYLFPNKAEITPNILSRPCIISPTILDKRMAAQCSRFLAWTGNHCGLEEMIDDPSYLFGNKETSRDVHLIGYDHPGFLGKIIIPENKKEMILRELNIVSVNRYTLFPGLDGLGRYLKESKEHSPLDITWF